MAQPKTMNGGRALLFERLIDFAPDRATGDDPAMSTLTMDDLRASVRREIARLLGSRTSGERRPALEGTVLDYGIPDFMDIDPGAETDRHRVARDIRQAIARFEPRLRRPQVTVSPGAGRGTLVAAISGDLAVGAVVEPLFFEMRVGAPEQAL